MVLGALAPGRVGRRQINFKASWSNNHEVCLFSDGNRVEKAVFEKVKLSTKESYSFFTPMKDTTLKAEYVDVNAMVVDIPFVTLDLLKDTGGAISYTVHRDVPRGYTLVQSSVILKSGSTGDLTIDTPGAIIGRIKAWCNALLGTKSYNMMVI